MNDREISQVAKKLLKANITISEAERSLNLVKVNKSMPFDQRKIHITDATRQIDMAKDLIQAVLKELQARMTSGLN